MNTVAIVGVGLIGGSIGIDIRQKKVAEEVVGIVRRRESIDECIRLGAVDRATLDIGEGVKDADMVILATPISIMPQIAEEVSGHIKKETVVIDIASVKGRLVNKLEEIFHKNYVGTHPMAGSEKRGVKEAMAGLFNGTVCIITSTENTRPNFLKTVREFWNSLGAKTVILSPNEHDRLVSLTSHLPHIVSASLVNIIAGEPKAPDCIGSGFKDSTRIASSQPALWQEICEWNKDEILASINKFQKELTYFQKYIETNDWRNLLYKFKKAKEVRDNL